MGARHSKSRLKKAVKFAAEVEPKPEVLPEPAPPVPTDPRLPLDARQVFRLKKSWKGIKRKMAATGTELFIG